VKAAFILMGNLGLDLPLQSYTVSKALKLLKILALESHVSNAKAARIPGERAACQ
jgi:hypothetical protein